MQDNTSFETLTFAFRSLLPGSQRRNMVGYISIMLPCFPNPSLSYITERLAEGGEGLHGYDDGEGDD